MKLLDLRNITFSKLYEIEITAEPQQEFSFTIDEITFDCEIQTFASGESRMNISIDGKLAINYAPINVIMTNLLFYSEIEKGALFFASDADNISDLSYKDFGSRLRLFYGSF